MTLELPLPPSKNSYKGVNWKRRYKYLKPEALNFFSAVKAGVIEACGGKQPKPIIGDVSVDILVRFPDRRRRDIQNVEECLLDGLTRAGVWIDDCQVADKRIRRGEIFPDGRVFVRISPMIVTS